jgi:hypothetical protein
MRSGALIVVAQHLAQLDIPQDRPHGLGDQLQPARMDIDQLVNMIDIDGPPSSPMRSRTTCSTGRLRRPLSICNRLMTSPPSTQMLS